MFYVVERSGWGVMIAYIWMPEESQFSVPIPRNTPDIPRHLRGEQKVVTL
jgi:hypothetical protein